MPINRSQTPATARFTVGLNIVLSGSKNMTDEEQDRLMTVEKVRVLIVDAADETDILLDEIAEAKLFSTGSVGYGLNTRNATFSRET
jgi:hypothetical protein